MISLIHVSPVYGIMKEPTISHIYHSYNIIKNESCKNEQNEFINICLVFRRKIVNSLNDEKVENCFCAGF